MAPAEGPLVGDVMEYNETGEWRRNLDLKAWAKATFGYGTAALPGAVDLALLAKSADTAQEIEIDPETALGLYQACAQLIPFTVEAQQAAVAAEADS